MSNQNACTSLPSSFLIILYVKHPHQAKCQSGQVHPHGPLASTMLRTYFDTIDDPETIDEAYTPSGKNHYSQVMTMFGKIKNTAKRYFRDRVRTGRTGGLTYSV